MLWFAIVATALGGTLPSTPCATPGMFPLQAVRADPLPPAPPGPKAVRDAFGSIPNQLETPNFVFKWGNQRSVSTAAIQRLSSAFEDAWEIEIGDMGHVAPYGTDTYLFNVYIGDTGNGAPPGHGAGGYYNTDPDGWPMIVVAANSLDNGEYADITAPHEFYHALQHATRRYGYEGNSAWYWEATATWASGEVYPSNPYHAMFLQGYAFLPHLPVHYFNYPDSGTLDEYHQYGAFIFPQYLSREVADWQLIRDSWTTGTGPDPMQTLAELLRAEGEDITEVWLDHVARNATWDYEGGDILREWLDYYENYYAEASNMVAAEVAATGTTGFVAGPSQIRPQRYGYNAIRMRRPKAGAFTFTVEGDTSGSRGSQAWWGARVVRVFDDGNEYVEMPFDGATGTVTLDDVFSEDEIWLVLGVWNGSYVDGESYGYEFEVAFVPAPDPDPDTDDPGDDSGLTVANGGCGCTAPGLPLAWGLALVPLAGLRRRRPA